MIEGLIAPAARLERLWTGGQWTEGPCWFADLDVLVLSDVRDDRMLQWAPDTGMRVFRRPSRHSNGSTRDLAGRLITCEHQSRRVVRTEADGSLTVLAERFDGKRFNSPNDVVVDGAGAVWFSDPTYGLKKPEEGGNGSGPELDGRYVFRIDPADGRVTKIADGFDQPNGLAFSIDGRRLYVADSGTPCHIRVFDVGADGATLSGGEVFCEIDAGAPDGFRFDTAGNLWTSAEDGVHVFDTSGSLRGKIPVPECVANLTFGGPDRRRLFVTASTSLYAIDTPAEGAQRP